MSGAEHAVVCLRVVGGRDSPDLAVIPAADISSSAMPGHAFMNAAAAREALSGLTFLGMVRGTALVEVLREAGRHGATIGDFVVSVGHSLADDMAVLLGGDEVDTNYEEEAEILIDFLRINNIVVRAQGTMFDDLCAAFESSGISMAIPLVQNGIDLARDMTFLLDAASCGVTLGELADEIDRFLATP